LKTSIFARMPWTFAAAATTALVGGFCAFEAGACHGPYSVEVATWIQAAGAILAILAGFAAGCEQASSERFLSTDDADDTDVRRADETALSAFICVICGRLDTVARALARILSRAEKAAACLERLQMTEAPP